MKGDLLGQPGEVEDDVVAVGGLVEVCQEFACHRNERLLLPEPTANVGGGGGAAGRAPPGRGGGGAGGGGAG